MKAALILIDIQNDYFENGKMELFKPIEASLKAKVTSMTNAKEVKIVTKIDSSLLGGLVVQIGTQVIDVSLKGQLRQISGCMETSIL